MSQHCQREGVKGAAGYATQARDGGNALAYLPRGLVGESQDQHPGGAHPAHVAEVTYAGNYSCRLSATRWEKGGRAKAKGRRQGRGNEG